MADLIRHPPDASAMHAGCMLDASAMHDIPNTDTDTDTDKVNGHPARRASANGSSDDDQDDLAGTIAALSKIPPPQYVGRLADVEVPRDGRLDCPLCGRSESFQAFATSERGWCCHGCGVDDELGGTAVGGTVVDFGARLWGMSTQGPECHELVRRLSRALLERTVTGAVR